MNNEILKCVLIHNTITIRFVRYELIRRWTFDKTKTKYFILEKTPFGGCEKRHNFNVVCKLKPIGT